MSTMSAILDLLFLAFDTKFDHWILPACKIWLTDGAEGKLNDAARIYDRMQTDYPDDISIIWISHKIMNQHDAALETLIHLDNPEGIDSLADFLNYAYFDARQFPILMAHLESQGVDPREPRQIPYCCKLSSAT